MEALAYILRVMLGKNQMFTKLWETIERKDKKKMESCLLIFSYNKVWSATRHVDNNEI